jgi:DNA-nicking Smr family endonuclease
MNFGDILDKWEKEGNSKIKIKETKPDEADNRFFLQEKRRRLRNKKPDDELDIHGMTRSEAWKALELFFNDSKSKGFDKILVIHGKGNHSNGQAVLKRTVMDFIEHCPFAGESGRGKAAAGGEGATWVLLK